ncbi:hypothetical protein PFICI_05830 [Pestalotiopsis fici W106-1]|uniref:Uncharacterized protein n=1 Tax=Pestalotiopsis fici (strain W106-1 / CGMCC3.15140) TaxID=1229662 RepID=W3XD61_PESFW|nr:uncharacterized protein PFICI_05830 [Pestalotiopsis fici W106-1]ETS83954.1 hypothetical protein PFICI_05830 [Pestalotiopsis fici W106-1]
MQAVSINSTQPLEGPSYIGQPAILKLMRPRFSYEPKSQGYHRDAGNTRSEDYSGPLGFNPVVETFAMPPPAPVFWSQQGQVTGALLCRENTSCIAALNPDTYQIEATYPGADDGDVFDMVSMVYMQILDNHVIVPTSERHLVDIERIDDNSTPYFVKRRDIDVTSVVEDGTRIVGIAYDANGNLWFCTGGFPGVGLPAADIAVIGYVDPMDNIHSIQLPGTAVENNFAVSGTNVYLVTGPAGARDTVNATANFYGFRPGPNGVEIVATVPYQAGDGIKKGGVSRGSGSTPSLLGDKYVAFTDNANEQVNLIVVTQMVNGTGGGDPICTVPLFEPGQSANENTMVVHWDGGSTYSAVVANFFDAVPIYLNGGDPFGNGSIDVETINEEYNNITQMAPGLTRIDVDDETKSCSVVWFNKEIRGTISPILSTKTGLLYMATQENELAHQGSYVQYGTGIDFDTGKEVFKVRMGAGGSFNYNYQSPVLTPDGGYGQFVIGGFVKMKDQN